MIKNFFKKTRSFVCGVVFGFLKKYLQDELRDILGDAIVEFSRSTAHNATMRVLEDQGLAHCSACPKRFGLRRVGKLWSCEKHFKAVKDYAEKRAAA